MLVTMSNQWDHDGNFKKQIKKKYIYMYIYIYIYTHTHTHTLFFFLVVLGNMWDLISLTRDQTYTPCSGSKESS